MYKEARDKEIMYKDKIKKYADEEQKRHKGSTVEAGDTVLVKYQRPSKGQTVYDPYPFTVTRRVGNRVYLKRNGKDLCRPLHFIKKVPPNVNVPGHHFNPDTEDDLTLMDMPDSRQQLQQPTPPQPVGSHSNLRSTLDSQRFRDRVLTQNGQPQNQLPAQQQPTPPTISLQQVPRYTSSGRTSRPVIGNRLIDRV